MEKSEQNPKGAGRKPIINGKLRQIITTNEEFIEIKSLLKQIRSNAKTKTND